MADGPGSDAGALNLKQVAMALGVHYTTAYRYVRQGRLPAERRGTEWRVPAEAVEGFRPGRATGPGPGTSAAGGSGTGPGVDAGVDGSSDADADAGAVVAPVPVLVPVPWDRRLVPALAAGDEPAAWRIVHQALDAGHDLAFCYLDMIAPALAHIADASAGAPVSADGVVGSDASAGGSVSGDGVVGSAASAGAAAGSGALADASGGGASAVGPALATVVAQRLVARLGPRFRRPGRTRGTVVLGGPRGEHHQLPLSMIADLVRGHGFGVLELGTDVPVDAFTAAAVRADRLVAVGLGATTADHLDGVRATIGALRRAVPSTPIVVGGQAVGSPDVARLLDADAWAPDGRGAVEVITDLARSGSGTGSSPRSGSGTGSSPRSSPSSSPRSGRGSRP